MENRIYPRFPVRYDVLCENIEQSENRIKAVVENASRTGLKVRFAGHLPPKSMLKLKIFKSLASKPISATGEVIWQKESPLVYGERMAGIHITRIGWTETDELISNFEF